jgi:hypothetical protein
VPQPKAKNKKINKRGISWPSIPLTLKAYRILSRLFFEAVTPHIVKPVTELFFFFFMNNHLSPVAKSMNQILMGKKLFMIICCFITVCYNITDGDFSIIRPSKFHINLDDLRDKVTKFTCSRQPKIWSPPTQNK